MAVGLQQGFLNAIPGTIFKSNYPVVLANNGVTVESKLDNEIDDAKGSDFGWSISGASVSNTKKVYYKSNSSAQQYTVTGFMVKDEDNYILGEGFLDTAIDVPVDYQIKFFAYLQNAGKGIKITFSGA